MDVNVNLFQSDVEQIPSRLEELADAVERDALRWPVDTPPRRILLTGMGSSHYAAATMARRLRAAGVDAVAELTSAEARWPAAPDLLDVGLARPRLVRDTEEYHRLEVSLSACFRPTG